MIPEAQVSVRKDIYRLGYVCVYVCVRVCFQPYSFILNIICVYMICIPQIPYIHISKMYIHRIL